MFHNIKKSLNSGLRVADLIIRSNHCFFFFFTLDNTNDVLSLTYIPCKPGNSSCRCRCSVFRLHTVNTVLGFKFYAVHPTPNYQIYVVITSQCLVLMSKPFLSLFARRTKPSFSLSLNAVFFQAQRCVSCSAPKTYSIYQQIQKAVVKAGLSLV